MGSSYSSETFDPSHVRIYQKLLHISSPHVRVQMIQTLLAGTEYVQSFRKAGIYSHLLSYIARVNAGESPPLLPGEAELLAMDGSTKQQIAQKVLSPGQQHTQQALQQNSITTHYKAQSTPVQTVTKAKGKEKALNYFQNCLLVLGLEEEVSLTEEILKSSYKKKALKAHPDKGGSEQEFEAVTRAYAYLTEILKHMHGGRTKESVVEAPTALKDSRHRDSKDWTMVEPVKLNPQKLDMNAFNTMYEKTRMPDPDDEGYGDWLKGNESSLSSTSPAFSGKFNRDIFNQTFESEAKKRTQQSTGSALSVPQAMTLAPTQGVELGRGAVGDYTAPANAQMKYTDLRNAYTNESSFSHQVANVNVDSRSFDAYASSRKRTPDPLNNEEMEAIQNAERFQAQREKERALRAAQEMLQASDYFARMKQLVLTSGPDSVRKGNRG